MVNTDVFVWLTVNCKSSNFRSVDTLSAQLDCPIDYFIYWRHANSTHLPYSSFALNFEFSSLVIRILRSTKSQFFSILLFLNFTQQKGGGSWSPWPPWVWRPWSRIGKIVSEIGFSTCFSEHFCMASSYVSNIKIFKTFCYLYEAFSGRNFESSRMVATIV